MTQIGNTEGVSESTPHNEYALDKYSRTGLAGVSHISHSRRTGCQGALADAPAAAGDDTFDTGAIALPAPILLLLVVGRDIRSDRPNRFAVVLALCRRLELMSLARNRTPSNVHCCSHSDTPSDPFRPAWAYELCQTKGLCRGAIITGQMG